MELRSLDIDTLHSLYAPCFKRDFPSDELMPWDWMENLVREGHQESLGFYDQQGLAAYAALITEGAGAPYQLLNYFAVEPERRGQGVGSQCLGMLRDSLDQGRVILFEVESPEAAASPEDAALRRRRIDFYLRCGAKPTVVDSWLFGVDYHIMMLAAQDCKNLPDSGQVAAAMDRLYHIAVREGPDSDFTFPEVCQVRVTT